MPKLFYMQFVVSDWRRDVAGCSLAAIGAWIQLCTSMFEANQTGEARGTLRDLASRCGAQADDFLPALAELQAKAIGDIHPDVLLASQDTIISVVNRRMFRKYLQRAREEASRKAKELCGNEQEPENNRTITGEKPEKITEITRAPKIHNNSNSNSLLDLSGSEKSMEESSGYGRAIEVMREWNAIPGAALFHNPAATVPLAEAIDALRAAGASAGKPVPDDKALLQALHRVGKRMAKDGLQNVWQPKTLAKFVGEALLVARGEVDPEKPKGTARGKPAEWSPPRPPPFKGYGWAK